MEINISRFFAEAEPFEFSRSRAEYGDNAGPTSWANAVKAGTDSPLLTTPEQLQALRDHVKGFGAWDDEEIAAWSDAEVNALFIQMISGDMREAGLDCDPDESAWQEYEENDRVSHNIFRGSDGEIYYYLGV